MSKTANVHCFIISGCLNVSLNGTESVTLHNNSFSISPCKTLIHEILITETLEINSNCISEDIVSILGQGQAQA